MKKIISLLLLVLMIWGFFAGCNKSDESRAESNDASKSNAIEDTPEMVTVWLINERITKNGKKITTYKYDENGRTIEEKHKTDYSESTRIYSYKYDDNGNVVERRISNSGVDTPAITKYEYDDKGQLIKEKQYDDNEKLHCDINYTNDNNGNMIEKFIVYSNYTIKYFYSYDNKGNVIEETRDIGEEAYKHIHTYNENSHLTKTTYYHKYSGEEFEEYGGVEYKYDGNGNMVEEILDYGTVIYKYDENGNMIECDGNTFKYTSIEVSAKRAAEIKKEQEAIDKKDW